MKKSTTDVQSQKQRKIAEIFREKNGYANWKELRAKGIHPRDLKIILADGLLIRLKSGLYRYADSPLISHQGFVDISFSVPQGVICLLSALDYHELTTFNPTFISVALPRSSWKPAIEYPPVEFFHFSKKQFEAGIDEVKVGEFNIRIYCPEKTICDCFRFRNKLGLDIAKEGLSEYLKRKDRSLEKLMEYAKICRVKPLMQTWLNALI